MKNLLLFLLLLLLPGLIAAQVKPKEVYIVNVNYPDHIVKASVLYNNPKLNIDRSLTYFWYTSNKIMETKGGFDGRILDGAYISYYMSNNLKEKGCFKTGLKDGEWITWFENGEICELINWKKGEKEGVTKVFSDKGVLLSETTYKDDKINGYQILYEGDKVVSKKKFKNGVELAAKVKKEPTVKSADDKTAKKHRWKLFKKKEKKEPGDKTEKKATTKSTTKSTDSTDPKTKKTFKEKFRALFKKKDKSGKPATETK